MMTVIDILEKLESTSSRNDKEDILRKHKHNDLLKKIFVAAGDPYTVYYVNKFKMPKARNLLSSDDDMICNFVYEILPTLSKRKLTGNAAKEFIINQFEDMDERQQKWCQRILLKNLRCGVQETTVNKIWPGSINSFAVQLAYSLKTQHDKQSGIKILEPISYPIRAEPKLDGLRCTAVKCEGVVTLYTRNGSILETLPRIKKIIERASWDNYVLDGEGLSRSNDWNTSASVMMSHKTKKDDENIVFNVFDAVPIDEWKTQKTTSTLIERCALVKSLIETLTKDDQEYVRQVEGVTVKNETELMKVYTKCMNEGFEGVMLKDPNAVYEFKRTKSVLKLKPVTTFEGVVVGHHEGRRGTKREGQFGGFEVVLSNGVITRVGSGFNDALRAEIQLSSPESYYGKVIECEAQPDPMTKDGLTNEGKMRFPVYVRFRPGADVDNSLLELARKYLTNVSN